MPYVITTKRPVDDCDRCGGFGRLDAMGGPAHGQRVEGTVRCPDCADAVVSRRAVATLEEACDGIYWDLLHEHDFSGLDAAYPPSLPAGDSPLRVRVARSARSRTAP